MAPQVIEYFLVQPNLRETWLQKSSAARQPCLLQACGFRTLRPGNIIVADQIGQVCVAEIDFGTFSDLGIFFIRTSPEILEQEASSKICD